MSNALQAIPTDHGLDVLTSDLKDTVTTYTLVGALTPTATVLSSFYSATVETSYYDENGVLTFILNLPIETHFDEYLHQINILDADGETVIECVTPKVALPKGIGGMVTLKAAITGEAGEVVFKSSEFVTETELIELHFSNSFTGTSEKKAVTEKALSAGLADAIAQLHATGWGAKEPVTILDFDSDPNEWNDGKSTLFRTVSTTENLPSIAGGVGMVIRYSVNSTSFYYLEFQTWQGLTYSKYWNGTKAVWSELAEYVTSSSFDSYLNQYGFGGKAPDSYSLYAKDFNVVTDITRNLTIGGAWINTPLGDGVTITGVLNVLRRLWDGGAAIIQTLHCHDGYQYRRVGTGDEESRTWSEWQRILTDADFEKTETSQMLAGGLQIQFFDAAYSEAGKWQEFSFPEAFPNRCVGWFALTSTSEITEYANVNQYARTVGANRGSLMMSATEVGTYKIVAFGD